MPVKRSKSGSRPTEFKVEKHDRPHDGFLRIERLWLEYKAYGEAERFIKPDYPIEVMIRGDSVAAILYDPGRRVVILVEQFRLPTAPLFRGRWVEKEELKPASGERTHTGGWLVETVAGSLRNRVESPELCLRREVLEEAGYRVTEVRKICEFFSSPGGTSEVIYLYYAEVQQGARDSLSGGGVKKAGEDIDTLEVPLEEFFDGLERQEYKDPKIIIAGYWLRDFLARVPQEPTREVKTITYALTGAPAKSAVIGIKTGNIVDVDGVDAWVNPENTNMQMDRYFGRSISAAIRWAGAEKEMIPQTAKYRVRRDVIADELRAKMGDRYHVGLGDVIDTGAGTLTAQGVKAIFHVAVAEGFVEEGLRTDVPTLKQALTNVLQQVAYGNRWRARYKSLLVPMIGTGISGLPVRAVAPALVETAISFLRDNPNTGLQSVFFNAYSIDDRSHLDSALNDWVQKRVLKLVTSPVGVTASAPTVSGT
jgi:ADP-ribose pyrophosphatase